MCAEGQGIQPNRAKPRCQQSSVLARRHGPLSIDPTRKEWLALVQILLLQPAPHSLAGLLCDLELNRAAGLPLHDRGSGSHPPTERYIVDPERDEVTGSQLAVEGQIEQSQIPGAMSNLEPDPNGPDLFGIQRRLGSNQLARFQGAVVRQVWSAILSCIAVLLKRSPCKEPGRSADKTRLSISPKSSSAYRGKPDVPYLRRSPARDPKQTITANGPFMPLYG